ncbi:ribosomal protein L1p/L10e family-domain-containing protein [Pestalotiopsis sp. NC0098]|nr:ribosomal protein L1p/L10e family-domain-containing protein [Pestalotiopsis sp. NC0098]
MAPTPTKKMTLRSSDAALQLVDPDQTLKASKALLAHMKKASKEKAEKAEKKNLLAAGSDDETSLNEQPVWLTLTTKRHIVDSSRLKPGKIVLPHALNTDPELSVCIISADPQRHYKNLVASEEFPEEWRKRVTRVIDVGKLQSKFKQYEEQRKLYAEHDIFLGDSRIINRLPKVLGKTFYKNTTKRPIPVNLESRNKPKVDGKKVKKTKDDGPNSCTPAELAAEVEKAVGSALVHLSPSVNTAVRVGYAGWSADKIAANANAVAAALVEKYVPQKDKNVRSMYLKGSETVALPLYMADELWLDGDKDIMTKEAEEAKALAEKANVGKKRKSLDAQPEEEAAPASKKAKKTKTKAIAESDDSHLDKEIAERKAKLKKQKAAAKKAVDV